MSIHGLDSFRDVIRLHLFVYFLNKESRLKMNLKSANSDILKVNVLKAESRGRISRL
jgi:hypothetical protein